jgi:signal transduction histidine kinase/DNA-binding response OmpR family regulator
VNELRLGADGSPARVLNVDDDEAARYVKTRLLRAAGWIVEEGGTGAQALELARTWKPDLIVLDIRLPDIDGISVCRQLKADPQTSVIMVLQTSATFVTSEDRVRGLEGGADHYLAQPFAHEELVATSRALLRIRRAELAQQQAVQQARHNAARLLEQNGRLSLLSAVAAQLLRAKDIEQAFAAVFQTVGPRLAAHVMLHYRLQPDGAMLLDASAGLSSEQVLAVGRIELGQGICGQVAASGVGKSIDLDDSSGPQFDFLRMCGLTSYLCMPMITADKPVGTLSFGRRGGDSFSDDEVQFVRTLTSYVSIAYERIRTHQQLLDHMKLLQEADRNKDEFLAMLAHELRNPLAPIVNAARLLRGVAPDKPEIARWQSVIERQSHHLTRLLDDLLDVARLSRGKIVLLSEVVSAQSIATAAAEAMMPQADERRQLLRFDVAPEPLMVKGDRVRLTQILTNLLHNAIKFSPDQSAIEISVHLDGDEVRFAVRDEGCGFAGDLQPDMFTLFMQGEAALKQPPGSSGLGLGLALVKRLVDLHRGRVAARSDGAGCGAEFIVWLPLQHRHADETPGLQGRTTGSVTAALKVLVVDDNQDAANTLAEVLRHYGHVVETAYNGEEALDAAQRMEPNVVVLDLAMPGKDGYETARLLRTRSATSDALLVALSGYGQARDRARSEQAGFDRHMVKPVDIEALIRLLSETGSRAKAQQAAR